MGCQRSHLVYLWASLDKDCLRPVCLGSGGSIGCLCLRRLLSRALRAE